MNFLLFDHEEAFAFCLFSHSERASLRYQTIYHKMGPLGAQLLIPDREN